MTKNENWENFNPLLILFFKEWEWDEWDEYQINKKFPRFLFSFLSSDINAYGHYEKLEGACQWVNQWTENKNISENELWERCCKHLIEVISRWDTKAMKEVQTAIWTGDDSKSSVEMAKVAKRCILLDIAWIVLNKLDDAEK